VTTLWFMRCEGAVQVFHLHVPKCAGTFVWRYLKDRFCEDATKVCGRTTLKAPPACECAVNPITRDARVLASVRAGHYRFVSAHSFEQLGASFDGKHVAIAAFFRQPAARVVSHYGYLRHRRHANLTSLESLFAAAKKVPRWASNQQWSLFVGGGDVAGEREPSPKDVARATDRLRATAFVGIVEHMDVALCLFAESFLPQSGDDLCAASKKPKQRENVAVVAPHRAGGVVRSETLDALLARHNRYDAVLYDLAARDFRTRVRRSPRASAIAARVSSSSSLAE